MRGVLVRQADLLAEADRILGAIRAVLDLVDGIAADPLEGSNRSIAALVAATLTTEVLGIWIRKKLRAV